MYETQSTRIAYPEPPEMDSDAKSIRQRLMGLSEQVYNMNHELNGVADRFWGPTEKDHPENVKSNQTDLPGDSLAGIHLTIDELYDLTNQLHHTAARFTGLA